MEIVNSINGKTFLKINKIDTAEKAYLLGFIAADAAINNRNTVEISLMLQDLEVLKFLSNILNSRITIDNTLNKVTKRFPRCRTSKVIKDITTFIKSYKKEDRNLPIVSKHLIKYLVLGFFDADGCITWGIRKDRNRVWQKVSFTSSYSLLVPIQKILLSINISTIIRPKSKEKCYILEFANKKDVLHFYDWLYEDTNFIILKRKYNNFNALRLKLGEFGETTLNSTIPSRAIDHSIEGVETSGEKLVSLNNHN